LFLVRFSSANAFHFGSTKNTLQQFSGDTHTWVRGFRCRFFFWNKGVTKVNTGSLAIMNNALIPVGLIINLVIWNKGQILRRFNWW
jgi:hypothetical protein